MRRIATVLLLLLTATAARAGIEDGVGYLAGLGFVLSCCAALPFLLLGGPVILLAIYDWRKARRSRQQLTRTTPPPGN